MGGVFALAATAILVIGRLQDQATAARDSQIRLTSLRLNVAQIQRVPWSARARTGLQLAAVRAQLQGEEQQIDEQLSELRNDGALPVRSRIDSPLEQMVGALWQITSMLPSGHRDEALTTSDFAAEQAAIVDGALRQAAARNRTRSLRALWQSRLGSAAVIVLLLLGFAWFYARALRARAVAEVLAAENRKLLDASQKQALVDSLTGLGNRRALTADLEAAIDAAPGEQVMVALFDLDGFKRYNDSFGHPAGDGVLGMLGARLAEKMEGRGRAYRIGGDEFCLVARVPEVGADSLAADAAAALSETGVGFSIDCSYGFALMPRETVNPRRALSLADQRMYRHKHSAAA